MILNPKIHLKIEIERIKTLEHDYFTEKTNKQKPDTDTFNNM